MKKSVLVIGRREEIDLPEIGAYSVEAKVDTGAFRTALHCIQCCEKLINGEKILEASFDLDGKGQKTVQFKDYTLRTIKNSFGTSEDRYCVRVLLKIGTRKIRSDVSLSDRSGMKYQVLIGRKTLGKKFLVDVSRVFQLPD